MSTNLDIFYRNVFKTYGLINLIPSNELTFPEEHPSSVPETPLHEMTNDIFPNNVKEWAAQEQANAIVDWFDENYDLFFRSEPNVRKNYQSPFNKTASCMFIDLAKPHKLCAFPDEVSSIKKNIEDTDGLGTLEPESYFQSYICKILPGETLSLAMPFVNFHEHVHIRYNLLLKKPASGGLPNINHVAIDVPELYCWRECGLDVIDYQPVSGNEPMMVMSFGYLLPYEVFFGFDKARQNGTLESLIEQKMDYIKALYELNKEVIKKYHDVDIIKEPNANGALRMATQKYVMPPEKKERMLYHLGRYHKQRMYAARMNYMAFSLAKTFTYMKNTKEHNAFFFINMLYVKDLFTFLLNDSKFNQLKYKTSDVIIDYLYHGATFYTTRKYDTSCYCQDCIDIKTDHKCIIAYYVLQLPSPNFIFMIENKPYLFEEGDIFYAPDETMISTQSVDGSKPFIMIRHKFHIHNSCVASTEKLIS